MKKIISSIAVVVFTFFVSTAQNIVTEKWQNGNKKSEGSIIGNTNSVSNETKDQLAQRTSSLIKDGKWSYWFENGTLKSEEYYNKGEMTGTWKSYHENGSIESETNFSTGKAVVFHKNGQKHSEGTMKSGMITIGKWTGYFENGAKNYEGTYNNQGQKDGVWKWWNEKGEVTAEQHFKNGTLVK